MTLYQYALSTIDNPFNPFDDFNSWFLFDIEKGYNSCGYLARIANLTPSQTEKESNEEIERAIDEIIQFDFRNIYKKVKQEISSDDSPEDTKS